jgi:hypothetical protein
MEFLPFHDIDVVNVYGFFVPEYGHDDCQANGRFGSGNGHSEKDKQLSLHGIEVMGARHKGQIYRVEHEFDAHENNDGIPPYEDANNANSKQDCAQYQIMCNGNHLIIFSLPA